MVVVLVMLRGLHWLVNLPKRDTVSWPIGYISSTKEWALRENKSWEPYWKDKNSKLIHFIGKDNIVFHCIIFPIILKAHDP